MTYIFFPTVVVAALGIFAAKAGDQLRAPLFERTRCAGDGSAVVWAYESTARLPRTDDREMRKGAWYPVRRSGRC